MDFSSPESIGFKQQKGSFAGDSPLTDYLQHHFYAGSADLPPAYLWT